MIVLMAFVGPHHHQGALHQFSAALNYSISKELNNKIIIVWCDANGLLIKADVDFFNKKIELRKKNLKMVRVGEEGGANDH